MNINKLFKKRLVFFITSTVFIVFVTVASSYAFSKSELNSDVVVMNNNNLSVLYENENITLNKGSYPMSFQQSNEIPTSKIKVINNKKSPTNYSLKITNKEDNVNNLEFSKIYYAINDNNPMLLDSVIDGIVYYGELQGKEEMVLNIKVWPASEFVTNEDQGKSVNLKFEVIEN